MNVDWAELAKKTVLNPASAAKEIMQLRRLVSNEMLWSMVIVISALMAVFYWVQFELFPPAPAETPQEEAAHRLLERVTKRPFLAASLFACGIVVLVNALHWTGRLFGGQGSLHDMAALFMWLQFFLIVTGALTLLLALVVLPLAGVVAMIANVLGIWILIAFVDAVHAFSNPLKALGVVVASVVFLLVGVMVLTILITLLGAGVATNV